MLEITPFVAKKLPYLLLNLKEGDEVKNIEINKKILCLFLRGKSGLGGYIRMWRLVKNYSLSDLTNIVIKKLDDFKLYNFPKIRGLVAPQDRLADITAEQFAFIDMAYYYYFKSNEKNRWLFARRLIATIYKLSSTGESKKYLSSERREVAKKTDKLDKEICSLIIFSYICSRDYIASKFPLIFKNKDTKKIDRPQFRKKGINDYKPLSDIILHMANMEPQPLGNLNECNTTNIYEFFSALSYKIN